MVSGIVDGGGVIELVRAAQAGDLGAFGELVRRYQGMAIAYGYALARDMPLAHDAAQETFVAAFFGLAALEDPAAFPGWLRTIVRTQCNRATRRRRVETVPLDRALDVAAEAGIPEQQFERSEARVQILAAVAVLQKAHREVLTLFYVQQYSQREIAAFLGVPVTTVNARLHAARTALRNRVLAMVREALQHGAVPGDLPDRVFQAIDDWRRLHQADRFGLWPSQRATTLPAPLPPPGFRPHRDPARCGCLRLAWPCRRCAGLEGVEGVPPFAPAVR